MGAVLEALRTRLASPDATHLTEAERQNLFGGMGSLTDLYLSSENGHTVSDERKSNARLDNRRSRLRASLEG